MATPVPWQRVLLRTTTVALAIAILYVGWTFGSRWLERRKDQQAIREREAADARKVVEQYDSGQVHILAFYANPPSLKRGEHTNLCFGVDSAQWVRIEPAVQPVKPALTRCVSIAPAGTTEYTLTAGGAGGKTVSQTLTVSVGGSR
jgi:hypothetical protein